VNPKKFLAELKRRNVYKAAIAYGIVAWLLMQVITPFGPIAMDKLWRQQSLNGSRHFMVTGGNHRHRKRPPFA
jgi:hypothetical protein